jgi:CRP-like cAMP-binding protein
MQRREAYRILSSRGWLAEIDPALAAAVLDAGRLLALRRGEAVFRPDDAPGGMYGVIEGGILLSTLGRDGLPAAGHIARRCHWFGYGSALIRQRRVLLAAANEPSVILQVPASEFERLRAEFPTAGQAFGKLATLGEMLYLATVADLLIRHTDRRLAAVLLRVTGSEPPPYRRDDPPLDPEGRLGPGGPGVPLTQALLGEMANASAHTVARFVERATRAGWIDWRYGRVCLPDAAGLAAFAGDR